MKYLIDTQLLLWAANSPEKISPAGRKLLANEDNELYFSAASLWEVVIKNGLGKPDFEVDPHLFRRGLIDSSYLELPVTAEHTLAVASLPLIHKDPFDRILVGQATVEGFILLTTDEHVAGYPGPIKQV